MPTLAELRAQKDAPKVPEATKTVTLIEGQHLLAKVQLLVEERQSLARRAGRTDEDGNRTGPPQKVGQGAGDARRIAEIDAEVLAFDAELSRHQGEVGLRGWTGGDWQRWKDAHPPREDNSDDEDLCWGRCDFTALFGLLGEFVARWEGDDLVEGDWAGFLADRIVYADRRDLVTAVVEMQEARIPRAPKSPSSSSETPTELPDSDSPTS